MRGRGLVVDADLGRSHSRRRRSGTTPTVRGTRCSVAWSSSRSSKKLGTSKQEGVGQGTARGRACGSFWDAIRRSCRSALDAGPKLHKKMVSCGDPRSAALVKQICDEEVGHVAKGLFWFRELCRTRSLPVQATFHALVQYVGDESSSSQVPPFCSPSFDESQLPLPPTVPPSSPLDATLDREFCPSPLPGPFNDAARCLAGMERELYEPVSSLQVHRKDWSSAHRAAVQRRHSVALAEPG